MLARVASMGSRAVTLLVLVLSASCSASTAPASAQPPKTEKAIQWTMRSAEYEAATYGTFAAAAASLPALLADATWTAALEQDGATARDKPPAVVVDVDETMLNNSQYQWERATSGESFDEASWDAWIQRAEARAVAGAVEYARAAQDLGVTIFYVTNRTCRARGGGEACPQAADTRQNLVAAGFPQLETEQLLLRSMRPEWSGDKSSRRSHVATTHRILQLLGDDLGDFIAGATDAGADGRSLLVEEQRSRWGKSWFLLPNPMYGSWVKAASAQIVHDHDPHSHRQVRSSGRLAHLPNTSSSHARLSAEAHRAAHGQ